MFSRPRLVGRRAKRLEFPDDDPSFVHLGLFCQPFELLQAMMLSWQGQVWPTSAQKRLRTSLPGRIRSGRG